MSWFFGGSPPNDPAAVKRRTGYQAPGTVLGPPPATTGTAVPRGTVPDPATVLGDTNPVDASLAAQQAAISAQAAHDKARKKATAGSGATVLTGLAGANTGKPVLYQRTLMGS